MKIQIPLKETAVASTQTSESATKGTGRPGSVADISFRLNKAKAHLKDVTKDHTVAVRLDAIKKEITKLRTALAKAKESPRGGQKQVEIQRQIKAAKESYEKAKEKLIDANHSTLAKATAALKKANTEVTTLTKELADKKKADAAKQKEQNDKAKALKDKVKAQPKTTTAPKRIIDEATQKKVDALKKKRDAAVADAIVKVKAEYDDQIKILLNGRSERPRKTSTKLTSKKPAAMR